MILNITGRMLMVAGAAFVLGAAAASAVWVSQAEAPRDEAPRPVTKTPTCREPTCPKCDCPNMGEHQAVVVAGDGEKSEIIDSLEDVIVKSGAGTKDGVPIPWEEVDSETAIRPDEFAAGFAKLQRDCPERFANARFNCDEYPCVLVEASPRRGARPRCKGVYTELGARRTTHVRSFSSGDGDEWRISGTAHPGGEMFDKDPFYEERKDNIRKRMGSRMDQLTDEMLRALCDGGDGGACRRAADYIRDDERSDREALLKRGCDLGYDEACSTLSRTMDDQDARMFLETKCRRGGAASCRRLSDLSDSRAHLERACTLGDSRSCTRLARQDCPSPEECAGGAVAWAQKAVDAERGYDRAVAQSRLGVVLCRRGKRARGEAAFVAACDGGRTLTCGASCDNPPSF